MNIRRIFDIICEAAVEIDPNVGTICYGDVYSINHIQTVKYPAVVVTCGEHSGSINDMMFNFKFNIFYIERLLDNQSNKIDAHANATNFLNGLLRRLDDELVVTNNYTINCFNERFNDMCAGAYVNVTIGVPIDQCYDVVDYNKFYDEEDKTDHEQQVKPVDPVDEVDPVVPDEHDSKPVNSRPKSTSSGDKIEIYVGNIKI